MYSLAAGGRVQISGSLTTEEIIELNEIKDLKVIQFSNDIELETFSKMNEIIGIEKKMHTHCGDADGLAGLLDAK